MTIALAVDIGGTKLAAGLVDSEGSVTLTRQVPTGTSSDGEELFATLASLVDSVVDNTADKPVVCGVGCVGPMLPMGETVSPLNVASWRDFPLRGRLAELTGLPTFIDNDAKALALGEGWIGAARGSGNFIGMVVSTGVGGGIVLGGSLLHGRLGNAGHIGHVVVEPDGRACACGGQGCLEAEISGPSIAAATGCRPEEADAATVERAGRLLGRAIGSVANLLDLNLAVVGGSVALGFGAPFFGAAQTEIEHRAGLDFTRSTRVVPAALGSTSGIVGAAAVGWHGLETIA